MGISALKAYALIHLFDFQAGYRHTVDDVGKQSHHIVVAHSHVGHNLLQRNLLGRVVLVFPPPAGQFDS